MSVTSSSSTTAAGPIASATRFRETFPTHEAAHKAAAAAAAEQRAPGETTSIEYETPDGQWREENARAATTGRKPT